MPRKPSPIPEPVVESYRQLKKSILQLEEKYPDLGELKPIRNIAEIVDLFDGPSGFGVWLGVSPQLAHYYINRGYIEPKYYHRYKIELEYLGYQVDPKLFGQVV